MAAILILSAFVSAFSALLRWLASAHRLAATDAGRHLVVHEDRVRKLAQDYRNLKPITKEAIQNCLDDSTQSMPLSYYYNECVHLCCSLLICI